MVDPISLVASPVIKIISTLTSDFIKEQYHLVYGVEQEVMNLQGSLTAIQATLREVKGTSSEALQDWLIKLKDAALDVEDVLEIYATKASRMSRKKRRLVATPLLKREAALHIKKIAIRINQISEERKNFHQRTRTNDHVLKRYGLQQTGSNRDISEIYGREEERDKIVNWILSEESDVQGEVCVLPIIGMAGLGKTTLAQLVYNDDRVTGHFDHRIWIDVTIQFNLKKIGKEIIEGVTEIKHSLTSWGSIVKRIEEVLTGKRFLIVLDDLWNECFIDWESLHQLFKKGRRGSRVVITSRISGVTKTVAARHNHFLEFLPEEACWSLFSTIAYTGNQGQPSSRMIFDIGRQIVQKCNGLPLAVSAMAILLRGCNDARQWQRVLREGIWGTELKNAANGETHILPALRMSYDHLPSHLKQCFAYCCIFPKSHTFNTSDLIKLWMAEGFVDSSGQSLPEETGGDYFEELRSRSFFHQVSADGREGYKIHHLLHDFATLISGQSCQVVFNSEKLTDVTRCRYVSLYSLVSKDVKKPASDILKVTKLRTFLMPTIGNRDFGQVLDKMFNTLEYLRVLDLSSSNLIELPKSIGNLQLLRYLDLSRTEIREVPSRVCTLINLRTLKLVGCLWLSKLPDNLSSLTNLRHLELDDMFWHNCSSLPPRIGRITNLQNLHSFPVADASGCGLDQLQNFNHMTGKLSISQLENAINAADANLIEKDNLKQLALKWSERQTPPQDPTKEETILGELEPNSNIEGLQISHYNGSQFPTWMVNESLRNLSKVYLRCCVNIRFLTSGLLRHVTELYIKGMRNLEEWKETEYLNLKQLKISHCPKLRTLPSSFPKLKIMKIKSCDVLKSLPVTPSLKSLILIDNIVLDNSPEQQLLATETSDADGEPASEILFSEQKLVNCPQLTGLRPTFQPHRLEISKCPLLKRLQFCLEHNLHLQHVALDRCIDGSLVEAIPSSASVHSLLLSNITNLISLPTSLQLSGLEALYIHECEDLTSLSKGGTLLSFISLKLLSVCYCPKLITLVNSNSELPTSLEYLSIRKCNNLESIGPQKCLFGLTALKDFYLEDCMKLKSFPENGLPISLKHLRIQGCPLLSQRWNSEKMAHIVDLELIPPS